MRASSFVDGCDEHKKWKGGFHIVTGHDFGRTFGFV